MYSLFSLSFRAAVLLFSCDPGRASMRGLLLFESKKRRPFFAGAFLVYFVLNGIYFLIVLAIFALLSHILYRPGDHIARLVAICRPYNRPINYQTYARRILHNLCYKILHILPWFYILYK